MKKNIFYWSPCLNPVGTVISTINSSLSLIRYSNEFNVSIINTCGEWDKFKNIFEKNNINVIDLNFKFFNLLPKTGFFQSRISYILIFFFSLIPLTLLLKKKKPDFIISHLITSLPIFIFKVLDFKTKLILRISGMPKFNIIRKYYWKICSSKIEIITCTTIELKKKLQILEIFDEKKIFFLPDAVINTNNFRKQIKTENLFNNIFNKNLKVFIAAGRLTRQKNFAYLIKEFEKFYRENNNYRLVIFGDGEEYLNLNALIKKKKLTESIFLLGRVDNIYRYMKDAEAFILSSKWEEMGFVIIEAAFSNLFIISSNCPNGPSEFLNNGKNGLLFENNKIDALYKSFKKFKSLNNEKKKIDCIKIKKNSLKFSMYRHFQVLSRILNN